MLSKIVLIIVSKIVLEITSKMIPKKRKQDLTICKVYGAGYFGKM